MRSLRNEEVNNGETIEFNNGFTGGVMNMIKFMLDNNIDINDISRVSNKYIDEINKITNVCKNFYN